MKTLPEPVRRSVEDWQEERRHYRSRVEPFVRDRRERRSRGLKHPVEDFIWEYYSLRGGRLLEWHPGCGILLEDASAEEFRESEGYRSVGSGRALDPETALKKRSSGVRWILNLLEKTQARPPVFACLGLHEWAMVYEEEDIRHAQLPLRLSHAETRKVVETLPLRCTHYDAFRFFSTSARPLNAIDLTPESRAAREQPGCIHANMDLFKWCMKLRPLIPSSLTLRCFETACRAREVDMRASPYDLGEFGGPAIRIETLSGRSEYVDHQQHLAEEARPLREELIHTLRELTPFFCK